jgi:hypothetical protein
MSDAAHATARMRPKQSSIEILLSYRFLFLSWVENRKQTAIRARLVAWAGAHLRALVKR